MANNFSNNFEINSMYVKGKNKDKNTVSVENINRIGQKQREEYKKEQNNK